ncbi:hypothetical protein TNCV_4865571 [Trichonephila clavipes]|nr:hypothetical protein TNCV_4865571 [Trichonephila clavipes]
MMRKWIRQFNEGRSNVHVATQSGRPSVVKGGLAEKVNEKIHKNRWLTILLLYDKFLQTVVQQWLSSLAASFFEETVDKLIPDMINV